MVTLPIGGTRTVSRTAPVNGAPFIAITWKAWPPQPDATARFRADHFRILERAVVGEKCVVLDVVQVRRHDRDLMGIVAALLEEAGAADRWEEAGLTVAELSEQLLMTAKGIKTSVDTLTAYRERMLIAIRIMMRSP
jgi:hypothetical protein